MAVLCSGFCNEPTQRVSQDAIFLDRLNRVRSGVKHENRIGDGLALCRSCENRAARSLVAIWLRPTVSDRDGGGIFLDRAIEVLRRVRRGDVQADDNGEAA